MTEVYEWKMSRKSVNWKIKMRERALINSKLQKVIFVEDFVYGYNCYFSVKYGNLTPECRSLVLLLILLRSDTFFNYFIGCLFRCNVCRNYAYSRCDTVIRLEERMRIRFSFLHTIQIGLGLMSSPLLWLQGLLP